MTIINTDNQTLFTRAPATMLEQEFLGKKGVEKV